MAEDSVEVEEGGGVDRDTSGALPVRCRQSAFGSAFDQNDMSLCVRDEFCEKKD